MFKSDFSTGRGIIIYTLGSLCVTNLELEVEFQEIVWCKINLNKTDNLLFGCVYGSPNCVEENTVNLFKLMETLQSKA